MPSSEHLHEALTLTPLLYAAVLDPNKWENTLSRLAAFLDSPMARVALMRISDKHLFAGYGHGVAEHFERLQLSHPNVYASDPRLDAALQRANTPTHCRQFLSPRALQGCDFYRTYLEPYGIEFTMGLPMLYPDADFMMVTSVMRTPDQAPYRKVELDRFALLAEHINQAGAIACRLHLHNRDAHALQTLFDTTTVPVVMVDRFCNILRRNQAAADLFKGGSCLRQQGTRLVHVESATTDLLSSTVLDVITAAMVRRGGGVRHIPLARAERAIGLQATICSLGPVPDVDHAPIGWPDSLAHAAIFINDPHRELRMSEERLMTLFDLTKAEANILSQLANGAPPKAIAKQRGTKNGTVSSQIKTIMGKTGCHRQFQLVRLVLFSEPPVRRPE